MKVERERSASVRFIPEKEQFLTVDSDRSSPVRSLALENGHTCVNLPLSGDTRMSARPLSVQSMVAPERSA